MERLRDALKVRPQHLARIDQLVEENRIVIAGPYQGHG